MCQILLSTVDEATERLHYLVGRNAFLCIPLQASSHGPQSGSLRDKNRPKHDDYDGHSTARLHVYCNHVGAVKEAVVAACGDAGRHKQCFGVGVQDTRNTQSVSRLT